jgi:hypothetical protein
MFVVTWAQPLSICRNIEARWDAAAARARGQELAVD